MKTLARFVTAVVVITAGSSACFGSPATSKSEHSGFLADYSLLTEHKDAKGQPVMRYVSPSLSAGGYHAVMIDPVVYYPAPKPDENVNSQTLTQIKEYFDNKLHSEIGSKVEIADAAGPGVARISVAITAVAAPSAKLKWYQLIPVALVVQGVKVAAGVYPKDARLSAELKVTDSESGEILGGALENIRGTKIKKEAEGADEGKKMVALDNVKPILNDWAELIADFMGDTLNPQGQTTSD